MSRCTHKVVGSPHGHLDHTGGQELLAQLDAHLLPCFGITEGDIHTTLQLFAEIDQVRLCLWLWLWLCHGDGAAVAVVAAGFAGYVPSKFLVNEVARFAEGVRTDIDGAARLANALFLQHRYTGGRVTAAL